LLYTEQKEKVCRPYFIVERKVIGRYGIELVRTYIWWFENPKEELIKRGTTEEGTR
jgi:hypothetical protein